MKKSILFVLSVLSAVSVSAGTPKLPSKCEAFRPQELAALVLKEADAKTLMSKSDFGQDTPPAAGLEAYWTVYSDRDNNQTYESPSLSGAKCTTLKFNETLRIAQIKGNFALVYVEPNKQVVYPKISEAAECKGWVPMSNLLLWQSCLASSEGIYNKALLCVNLESIASDPSNAVGVGYREPSTKSKGIILETDINFYFIMKEENGMALLANQSKMDGDVTDQVLEFWVPKNSYVPWNQRSCLEPTWKIADVNYFATKDIVAPVYGNKKLTGDQISKIRYELQDLTNVPPVKQQYIYRMPGNSLRYPILDDGSNTIYNMSTFSSNGDAVGGKKKKKTPEEIADSIKKARLEKMQHINLAIVIDGTSSMEPYYPAVKDAIKEGLQFFKDGYKIKVGVVIYRDYDDGEDGLCEIMPLTSINNIERFNDFLDKGGDYGIKSSSRDKTNEEALFYGINMALDTLRFNDGESNMMLVVGDCGNVENDRNPSESDIIAKMSKLNIHPMSFQVQNQNQPAWNSFNNQMNKMFRLSLTQNYKQISDSVKLSPRVVMTNGIQDGYDFKANVAEQLYIGMTRYANANENGGKKDPSLLTKDVTASILEFANTIQKQIDMIASAGKKNSAMFVGGARQGGNLDVSDAFIKQRLGEEYAKAVKESGALINFSGYISKQHESGRDYFMPVIFISDEEFQEMMKRLSPVAIAAQQSNTTNRKPYIDAMIELVRTLAPGLTNEEMAKLSNNDITKMIGGLNEAPKALSYSLDKLSDPNAVPNTTYMRIIKDFADKYKRLNQIKSSKTYEYVKEFNSARYYWIPIENLP